MEEQIKEAIEKCMEQIIPGYIDQLIRIVDERNNQQVYSIRKAFELTGIGYTKL